MKGVVGKMLKLDKLAADDFALEILQHVAGKMARRVRGRPDVVLVDGVPGGNLYAGIRLAAENRVLEPERRIFGMVVEPERSGCGGYHLDVACKVRIASGEVL